MADVDASALQPYASLLRQLRDLKGVSETRPGVYSMRREAFIHFHSDSSSGNGVYAHLKKPGGAGFDRYPLDTPAAQRKFIDDAKLRAKRFDDDDR